MKKNFKKYLSVFISVIMLIGIMPVMSVSADYMNTSAMTELFTLDMNKTENSVTQNYVESVGRGATGTLKDSLVVKTTSNVDRVNRSETDKALSMSSASGLLNISIPEQTAKDENNKTIISFDFNLGDVSGARTEYFGVGGDFWFEKDGEIVKRTIGTECFRQYFASICGSNVRYKVGTYNQYSEYAFESGKWYNMKLVLGYDSYSIYIDGALVKAGTGMSYYTIPTGTDSNDSTVSGTNGYNFLGVADKIMFTNRTGTNSIDNISVYTGKVVTPAFTNDFTGYTGGRTGLSSATLNFWSSGDDTMTAATGVYGKAAADTSQKVEWETTGSPGVLQLIAKDAAKNSFISGADGSSILSFSFATDGKAYPCITAKGVETAPYTIDGTEYTNGTYGSGSYEGYLLDVKKTDKGTFINAFYEDHAIEDITTGEWHTIVLIANGDNTYSLYFDGKAVVENHEMKNMAVRYVSGGSFVDADFRGFTQLWTRTKLNAVSSDATSACMYYDDISLTATPTKYTADLTKDIYSVSGETVENNTLKTVTIAKDNFVSPTATMYAASYDSDGRMSDVKTSQILSNMLPGEAEISVNLSIPEGGSHKVFVWDKETLKPLMKLNKTATSATTENDKKLFVVAASIFQSYNHYGDTFRYPRTGAGQVLNKFFGDGITVSNKAMSGRSSKKFYYEYWSAIKEDIKPGDYVFIQLGHNDWWKTGRDEMNATHSTNPTLPSTQEYFETHENIVDTGATANYQTSHYSYKWYLRQYIEDTRAKGGIPILIAGIDRMSIGTGAVIEDSIYAPYRDANYELGEELDVPVLDVNTRWRTFLQSLETVETVRNYYFYLSKDDKRYVNDPNFDESDYYKDSDEDGEWDQMDTDGDGVWTAEEFAAFDGYLMKDGTHLNEYSAELVAEMIAKEIKANPVLADLAQYLNDYVPVCNWPELQYK
ncbi:MAG: hypothetical protein IJC09_05140 [Clostridia bacterium]|nr:hypothetical protein [Clostridia bacterium]